MIEGKPSATAYRAAVRRAAHQLLDKPVIFDDPLALTIVGGDRGSAVARDEISRADSAGGAALRAFIAARARFAEDRIAAAVDSGVRHVVVLGAGLDTFAYRNPFADRGVLVYEVDHPATQAWKRQRLQQTQIAVPPSVRYVAVDFSTDRLDEKLAAAGLDTAAPAFFTWLGVVPYLDDAAIASTLGVIAARRGGAELVFDYAEPPDRVGMLQRLAFLTLAGRAAALGEPIVSYFRPDEIEKKLAAFGFSVAANLAGPDLGRLYAGGASALDNAAVGHVLHAVHPSFA
ncbi:SAM-dependent methyltransferase [Kaistia geumhonensis]|uniref:S-adenosyl-L-methionine-dependent methyltransferase n=1 Tax=Kaistia geumhonensis TaxID=410839 RepID=A0ABU0MCP7_9HYPH|nr:SAM-dependent methyltransferase [Kaistia geumhonensis]MCX5481498.1 SAM-dependent methyltransferase [Kaistia geumhonensis]MDQ0518563.1 methyltransferase (TIGR00027 family) [Kaistia geumhonensis]